MANPPVKWVDVPGAPAAAPVASAGPTFLRSPTGETVRLDNPEQLEAAKAQGYTLASAHDINDYRLQEKYGDTAGQLKSFGLGAARGATFGLSDVAARGLGMSAEDLAGYQQANPTATGLGEATGVGASLLVPGLGEANAVKGVARAGQGVARVAEAALPTAESLVGRIAKHAIAQGAGLATEGAAYGMGHEITEAALGDPNQTASSVIQHVGLSALLGGGLGAALGVGETVLPKLVDSAGQAIKKTTDKIAEHFPDYIEKITGVPSEYGAAVWKARASTEEAAAAAIKSEMGVVEPPGGWPREVAANLQETYDTLQAAAKEGAKIRPVEVEQLAAEINPQVAGARMNQAHEALNTAAADMRSAPENFGNYGAKVQRIADALQRSIEEDDPLEQYQTLLKAKRAMSKLARPGNKIKEAMLERDALNAAGRLAGHLAEATTDAEAWGESAARTAKFNAAKSAHDDEARLFRKYFMSDGEVDAGKVASLFKNIGAESKDKVLNNLESFLRTGSEYKDAIADSAANAGMPFDKDALGRLTDKSSELVGQARQSIQQSALADSYAAKLSGGGHGTGMGWFETGILGHLAAGVPGVGHALRGGLYAYKLYKGARGLSVTGTVGHLARLEQIGRAVSGAIDRNAHLLIRGGERTGQVGRAEAAAGIGRAHGQDADSQRAIYDRLMERVNHLSDPQTQMDHLHQMGTDLYPHAPNTTAALQQKVSAAITHLKQSSPSRDPVALLDKPAEPSDTEVARFLRRVEAIDDPVSVLKKAAVGALTKEHMEALQAVHPELLASMGQAALSSHAGYRGIVPHESRTGLGLILGAPVTVSRNAQSLQTTAGLYKSVGSQGPQAPNPTASKASKLSLAQRTSEGTTSQPRQPV